MKRILDWAVAFGQFWYGFVIGDDWRIAAAVAVALGVTYGLRAASITAWWLIPAVSASVAAFAAIRTAGG